MKRKFPAIRALACTAVLFLLPLGALASGEKEGKLVHVADTRHLSGFNLYIADLYNTNRLLFTLECIAITALMGLFLGLLMDWIVGAIGLDLSKHEGQE
ncbi:MAG: hypothetical protein JHC34_06855 [Acidobacteria bacterium]|jgi:hypothetical protein|nr:hypothetical protein [Acidobacteriota bacterium]